MLSTKLRVSLRANSVATRTYISSNNQCFKQTQQVCEYAHQTFLQIKRNRSNVKYLSSLPNSVINDNAYWTERTISTHRLLSRRTFVSENLSQRANVFGDLGDRKYERVEMDEVEKEEEKFTENEAKVPRKLRLSPGQYAKLIKSHIGKGDLSAALGVLDIIKNNRDKSTTYMYNLLIRAFAVEGDLKRCFKLYNDMKKRSLKVIPATYTSLLNVCANSTDTTKALEKLEHLKMIFLKKGYTLNETNFNVMIKAYGRHNRIVEAFQVADEMRDQRIRPSETTFNCLLHAAIADKEFGVRHALTIWHLMQFRKLKPNLLTYNLLLRAFRDCEMKDIDVNEYLIPDMEQSKVHLVDSEPDLLASPPVLSTLVVSQSDEDENIGSKIQHTKNDNVNYSGGVNMENALMNTNDLPPLVPLTRQSVSNIFHNNRLLLFGGFEGILSRMENSNLTPNTSTITLLMELIPPTNAAEMHIIRYARNKGIPLDTDFYNMLIKKRSLRFDYESARDVLYDMQKDNLQPNIMTWGVLALGCRKVDEIKELLCGIEATGHELNVVIVGTLINSSCRRWQFNVLTELLNEMQKKNIRPNNMIYRRLEIFSKYINKLDKQKEKPKWLSTTSARKGIKRFNLQYPKWLDQMQKKGYR